MPKDRTPVVVGAGQYTQRDVAPEEALPPIGIAAEAARAAMAAAGAKGDLAAALDTIAVTRTFSDSTPRRSDDHGRATNPPRSLARDIGADPARAVYSEAGGEVPQRYVNEYAEMIAGGEAEAVLLAGGEAIATDKAARRAGLTLDWQDEAQGELDDRGFGVMFVDPRELAHGIGFPVQTYPLFEQAIRGRRGHGVREHLAAMGRLLSPFTAVAAENPYAYFPRRRSAEEIATPSAENPFIGFPYTLLMNARDGVDQGAALVLTSAGKADELGIPEDNRVYLHGCADLREKLLVGDRVNYHSFPAIRLAGTEALAMAGIGIDEVRYFDLYSCFPSAVEATAEALGIAEDDERGLTLTGGLPYFGGPGNNYTMHAIAEAWRRCRDNPGEYALVNGNGGYLTKHAIGIYSTRAVEGGWRRPDTAPVQQEIDAMQSPAREHAPAGQGTVETYTVVFGREGAARGIVIGRLEENGARFIANTPNDPALLTRMVEEEFLERGGTVAAGDVVNTFTPD
ncbi:MAG TPA: acetyl-CoA acetyltransferase [Woeseiaceae bacterium]|nr:acetyl-CoA acetyltransferase [Woeseiaceae bacterium]